MSEPIPGDMTDFRNIQRARQLERMEEHLRHMQKVREWRENSERLAVKTFACGFILCVGLLLIGTHPGLVFMVALVVLWFTWLFAWRATY